MNSKVWCNLRKITVNPFDSIQNKAYEVGQDGFHHRFLTFINLQLKLTHFTGGTTWKFQVTIPDDLLSSAFLSAEDMGNFIGAITSAMSDSMVMSLNDMSVLQLITLLQKRS